jgi:hypothetical protein
MTDAGNLDALGRQGVNAQCDAFDAAIDAAVTCFGAYRQMVAEFRATGTLAASPETRARIARMMPTDAHYEALNTLDHLAGLADDEVTP